MACLLLHWSRVGHWKPSAFLGLPELQRQKDSELQRWQVVAGGLALVLSRLSRTEVDARFVHSERLYRYLHPRLARGRQPLVAADLLSDVMHEVAEVADPLTRRCLRALFDAATGVGAGQADGGATIHAPQTTRTLESQPRPGAERGATQPVPARQRKRA